MEKFKCIECGFEEVGDEDGICEGCFDQYYEDECDCEEDEDED